MVVIHARSKVFHNKYGAGEVIDLQPSSRQVGVEFNDGKKRFVNVKNLKKMDLSKATKPKRR